jgi:uncharacterized protein YgiM (DUF1202 family)
MKLHTGIYLTLGMLIFAGLACAQAGSILTPEEATQQAQATAEAGVGLGEGSETDIHPGDTVEFVGSGYLVLLRDEPGSSSTTVQSQRGVQGTVKGSQVFEDDVWYLVETVGGEGWLPSDLVELVESEETETFQEGDVAYLVGSDDSIDILQSPGTTDQVTETQSSGVEVTILEASEVDNALWYRVDTPTSEGWVAEENVTAEAP